MADTPKVLKQFSPALLSSKSKLKDPVAIYNNYRRTCSLLYTPQSADFKKICSKERKRFFSPVGSDDSIVTSINVQKQLVSLFD